MNMRTQKNLRSRGVAIIELALGVGLLVLLMAGVSSYGPMLYSAIEVGDAARAGAVYGSSNLANALDIAGMQNVALASARNVQSVAVTATQTCQCSLTSGAVGCTSMCSGNVAPMVYVNVTARTTTAPLMPYPLDAGSIFIIKRTATMRVQ